MGPKVVVFLALSICSAATAWAMADPALCTVDPADALNGVIVCPDRPTQIACAIQTVTIRDSANNPIPNCVVCFNFADGINICPNAVLCGTTDASGVVVLSLAAGGCLHNTPGACTVTVSCGPTIRSYSNVKSPDFDGGGPNLCVDLADLQCFVGGFLGSNPPCSDCHDYDNTGGVDLGDLVCFAPAFINANCCP